MSSWFADAEWEPPEMMVEVDAADVGEPIDYERGAAALARLPQALCDPGECRRCDAERERQERS